VSKFAGLFDAEEMRDRLDALGALVWYTVREASPTRDQLRQALAHARFDPGVWLPKEIFPRDAFRRATSDVERHRVPIEGEDGRFMNLLVREVSREKDRVVRHIVTEVVDSKNVRLSYTEKIRLTLRLDGGAPWVDSEALNGPIGDEELTAKADAIERFDHALHHYDGRTVREMVHQILLTAAPIAVKSSGGVYFVSRDHQDTVDGLKRFVAGATNNNGSRVWAMPVYDDGDAKAIIEDSLVAHVEEEGQKVIEDLAALLRGGEATEETMEATINRVAGLAKRTEAYERLLGEHVEAARTALEVARTQITTLWDRHLEGGLEQ